MMPVHKGTDNFYKSRREKLDFTISRIDAELKNLKNSKKFFKNFSEVCDEICPPISKAILDRWIQSGSKGAAPAAIVKSTLYRRDEYYRRIKSYLENQPFKGTENHPFVSDAEMISDLRLELANAKNQNNIMRRHMERNESASSNAPQKNITSSGENFDFIKTAQVVALLLEASEGQFVLQPDGGLIDLTKRVNNIIASASLLGPFKKWLKEQEKFSDEAKHH